MSEMTEKIARLLRLAGNNPNVNEANAALLKARALMMEHHLTEADLPGQEPEAVRAVNIVIDTRHGTYPGWMGTLSVALAKAFRCDVYLHPRGSMVDLHLIGLPDDVDALKALFPWVRQAAMNLGLVWVDKNGGDITSYYRGFALGLRTAFDEQTAAHKEQWALVLVKHPSVVQEAEKHGVQYSRTGGRVDGQSFMAGRRDGYEVGRQRSVEA